MAPVEIQQSQQVAIPAQGGSISLSMLIDFIVQRTYHDLTVLAELLPRKTDMERKIGEFLLCTEDKRLQQLLQHFRNLQFLCEDSTTLH